ncbi:MAG: RNA methyltransferase [Pseudobdellovibrionaceae bacterium]
MSRGYFGIGVEGIHKPGNVGNLLRSAHAFGANFFFTISPDVDVRSIRATDTARSFSSVPYYEYERLADMPRPKGAQYVAVEFMDDAVMMPSFRHPKSAVYILGPERSSVSEETLAMCDHKLIIPTQFCINVGVAGALVMYDRIVSSGRYLPRPVKAGGPKGMQPENFKASNLKG